MAAGTALQNLSCLNELQRPHLSRIPAIAEARARLLEGILRKNSNLPGNEALVAATLLQLYHADDGYRKALGDFTLSPRLRLYPIYLNLPHPTDGEADALFLRLVRQLNQLRTGI